ncbi:MAG TPA: archease [Acidobacteriota bacterium]|nr:archease [Acidobacteriota bacterium]
MPFRFLEDEAPADVAFQAWGDGLEEVFTAAADATLNCMIGRLDTVRPRVERAVELENSELDLLLFDLLQEIIYYKDSDQLLLRVVQCAFERAAGTNKLSAKLAGEKLDPSRHEQRADVKAVTLHQFWLRSVNGGWETHVILDV